MKKVLLIAGAGTLGGATYPELIRRGYAVDVVSLEDFRSVSPLIRYYRGFADIAYLERLFAENPRYEAIVDFVHTPVPSELERRIRLLVSHTDQFVFLSSYRTYADVDAVITESSPQWLDAVQDETYLTQDDYAIPKAKGERILASLGRKNWTIVRPLISFSHYRLDLVTVGAYAILYRTAAGKPVLLPAECRDKHAGVGWAGNVGREIAALIGNERALGEAFTLGTPEEQTWGDVAGLYERFGGCRFLWIPVEDYLTHAVPQTFMHRQMIYADRILDRRVDLSKVLHATGLDPATFKSCRDAVADELAYLSERPDLVRRFDTPEAREVDARTDAYLAQSGRADASVYKPKIGS